MVGLIIASALTGHTTVLWRLPAIEIGSVIAALMFLFHALFYFQIRENVIRKAEVPFL